MVCQRLPRVAILLVAILSVIIGSSPAADLPTIPTLLTEGTRALDEGLPQVAAYKLRAFLRSHPDAAARREATLVLARALVAVPDGAAALAALDAEFPLPPTPADAADPTLAFWRAQALAALGRWPEALEDYTRAANAPKVDATLAAQARFGRGEALLALASGSGDAKLQADAATVFKALGDDRALGPLARLRYAEIALDTRHLKEANRALGDLPPGSSFGNGASGHALAKEHAYLMGRLRLAQRQTALAQRLFASAVDESNRQGLTARLLVDNYWGWARACLDEDQPDSAQQALENLIERYPRQPYLAAAFSWLETLYIRVPNAYLADLQRWSEDADEPEREALARVTLAHLEIRQGRPERAEMILAGFGADFPRHELRARAWLDLAALRLDLGRNVAARAALVQARRVAGADERWRTGLEALEARLSLAENDNAGAAERFAALADRLGTGAPAEAAAFNATLAALRSGDAGRFDVVRAEFNERFPRSPLTAEFPLEEGLALAEQAGPPDPVSRQRAIDRLRLFLADHPAHPRAAEAHLALAEFAFEQAQPDIAAAQSELDAPSLRRVSNDTPAPANAVELDRADYLAIWLADAPGSAPEGDKAIALAKRFLETRPDSPLAAEVRMKLGEIYFARGDYPDAQTQLELLADQSPNSPLLEAALYLAGRAAASSMSPAGADKAVELFNRVERLNRAAKRNGPFRLPARLRLAEAKLGKPEDAPDALVLYGDVLTATGGPGPLSEPDLDARCTALCGRGQTLMTLAANDPRLYKDATAAFDQLATGTPGASLRWRRQAFTLKGHVFEQTGDSEAALAAYDDALNAPADPATGAEGSGPEWTWFYRAGSDAAKLLKQQQQWGAMIAIYKKLTAADGPMKSEFEKTLANLRLEHFIWED